MAGGPAAKKPRSTRYRRRVQVQFSPQPDAPAPHRGFTTDVSVGGFCLSTYSVVRPGTRLWLTLSLGERSARVEGVVMWARAGLQQLGQTGAMGVRLMGADAGYEQLVASLSEGAARR